MKPTNELRFGQTASGTVGLARRREKPRPADEKMPEPEDTKIDRIKTIPVE